MRLRHLIAGIAGLAVSLPATALACGGFFCNGVNPTPINQSMERVLFAPAGNLVTMHVEVGYEGEPTNFSWLLPVPERPTAPDGSELPLDQMVRVSSQHIFEVLQQRTRPTFDLKKVWDESLCPDPRPRDPSDSDGAMMGEAAADMAPLETIEVLETAKVGPYDATLVSAGDADELFLWLNINGYFQDPAARPILEEYVGKEYYFIAIRLQNDKSSDDLKPLAMTFGENAPCIPLQLTGIAAVENMPMHTWVIGDGRAVPKNYIHALVNEQAIRFPEGSNYTDVVTAAVNELQGRAWVTEYSGAADDHVGRFLPETARDTAALEAADSLHGALLALDAMGIPLDDADFLDILRDTVSRPESLDDVGDDAFYGKIDEYAQQEASGDIVIGGDLATLAARVIDEIVEPRGEVEDLLGGASTLTRFFTTISPDEMTRDPLFAFNPDLPAVDNEHVLTATIMADEECEPFVDAVWSDGRRYTFECPDGTCDVVQFLGPVPDVPALLAAEVLDESGPPIPFDAGQSLQVDAMLAGAVPGSPSLPEDFDVETPEEDPTLDPGRDQPAGPVASDPGNSADPTDSGASSGCAGGPASGLPWLTFVGVCFIALKRRRTSTAAATQP